MDKTASALGMLFEFALGVPAQKAVLCAGRVREAQVWVERRRLQIGRWQVGQCALYGDGGVLNNQDLVAVLRLVLVAELALFWVGR